MPGMEDYFTLRAQADATPSDDEVRGHAAQRAREAVQWCRDHLGAEAPEPATALVRQAGAEFRAGWILDIDGRTDWAFVFSAEEALKIRRSAFVEIVRLPGRGGRYCALVITSTQVTALDLGSSQDIDALTWEARIVLEGLGRATSFRDVLPPGRRNVDSQAPLLLSRRLLEPLRSCLRESSRAMVVLDGPLLHLPSAHCRQASVPALGWPMFLSCT
ncbi:hypothetical protein [Streptomyces sp. S.PB5]|uniref:hypothetical protein n=1 Tax=Streptomyces sp. S.PB5 TaxID=3020844 RepID=UPI0025B20798|nr:hypothetical protein [Streptomyces sp. S.PB5]MDN3025891.1 hypothetical protein [Streptomyces sp. S.PB5]